MSATFKIAKKKYTQNDLRRLMQEQKSKTKQAVPEQKIESPLAKYNDAGQLTCVLCKSVVRSESVWKVHVNTKSHKEHVAAAKQLKEKLENTKQSGKRPGGPLDSTAPEKSLRTSEEVATAAPFIKSEDKSSIPSDFFDSKSSRTYFEVTLEKTSIKKELINIKRDRGKDLDENEPVQKKLARLELDELKDEMLPEGFFDDPIKDAKIRNLEYKDPQEEEWERFQREIKAQSTVSNAIIAEEREEATAERQIEEIDEQIQKWSKVLDLERKKEVVSIKLRQRPTKFPEANSESDTSDIENENFDEFLDWRAKRLGQDLLSK